MLVGQERIALRFSPMGLAFSPTVYLHMLRMPSIVTGKGLKLLVALVSLEGLPYWFQLILVSPMIIKIIDFDYTF
jgi:hypothetical protein